MKNKKESTSNKEAIKHRINNLYEKKEVDMNKLVADMMSEGSLNPSALMEQLGNADNTEPSVPSALPKNTTAKPWISSIDEKTDKKSTTKQDVKSRPNIGNKSKKA